MAAMLVQKNFAFKPIVLTSRHRAVTSLLKNFKRFLALGRCSKREATKMSQKASSAAKGSSKSKGGGSKNKGGFVSRQAKAGKKIPLVTEAELLAKKGTITSKDVLGLEVATQGEHRRGTPSSQSPIVH